MTQDFINYGDSLVIGSGTTLMHLMSASIESQIARDAGLDLAILTSNLQVLYAARDAQREHVDIFGGTQVLVEWRSQTPPVTIPLLLRVTRLPVARRASGFVLVAKCRCTGSATRTDATPRNLWNRFGRSPLAPVLAPA